VSDTSTTRAEGASSYLPPFGFEPMMSIASRMMTMPGMTGPRDGDAMPFFPAFGFEPMIALAGRMMAAQATTQAHFLSQMKAFHDELHGFVDKRLDEDRASNRLLAGAAGPEQVAAVWSQFLSTAVGDYARETSRMAELASRAFTQAAEDIERQTFAATRLAPEPPHRPEPAMRPQSQRPPEPARPPERQAPVEAGVADPDRES
jgi:hypothetical protein